MAEVMRCLYRERLGLATQNVGFAGKARIANSRRLV